MDVIQCTCQAAFHMSAGLHVTFCLNSNSSCILMWSSSQNEHICLAWSVFRRCSWKDFFFLFLFYQSSDCLGGKRFNEALKDFCTILFADLNREVVRLPILPNVLLWCSLIVTSMTKFNNNKQKETLHLAASVMFMSWISTFCGFSAFHAFSHGAKFPNWIFLLTIIHFWDHILEGSCTGRGSVIGKGLSVPN